MDPGRTESFESKRRAEPARRVVGDAVPFVCVDPVRDEAAMPRMNVVVDADGRVVFATDDVALVGAAAERLLRR